MQANQICDGDAPAEAIDLLGKRKFDVTATSVRRLCGQTFRILFFFRRLNLTAYFIHFHFKQVVNGSEMVQNVHNLIHEH